ncbi:MAG: YkgJ family cysteine cluster protein [Deltaproteobacteria bacterium]|nr:YkgJ family cysteine cluster protein [Deltaproteobacteria bacterium]
MPHPLPIVDGRRFGCTRCGNCCMQPGYVYFHPHEVSAIAEYLGISEARFTRAYDLSWMPGSKLWALEAADGQGCPLLTEDRLCSVQPVKPAQCRTFPFWPELLDDAARWERTKAYCPGLDAPDGRLYAEAEIRQLRAEASEP